MSEKVPKSVEAEFNPGVSQDRLRKEFLVIERPPSQEERAKFQAIVDDGRAYVQEGKFVLLHSYLRFPYGNVDLQSGWIFDVAHMFRRVYCLVCSRSSWMGRSQW